MFEHFTFGAQAQTRYCQQEEVSASPTDISFISTQPPRPEYPFPEVSASPAINDIVNKLTGHTLVPDDHESARPSIWAGTASSPTFDDPFAEGPAMSFKSTRRGIISIRPSPAFESDTSLQPIAKSNVACRRLQRQLNTQLQTCTTHVKDISALVEDMITSNSQCTLHKTTPRPSVSAPTPPVEEVVDDTIDADTGHQQGEPDPNEDEGFAEMDDPILTQEEEMSLRRAGLPTGIRKYASGVKYRSASEYVPNTYIPREKTKIRCVPRMRKRRGIKPSER